MARDRGRDTPGRKKKTPPELRPREVYVLTEGEVTEPGFVEYVRDHGTPKHPGQSVEILFKNLTAPTKRRKPLPLVEEAIPYVASAEKAAKKAGLEETDWNWPQVWCLFDRDQHKDIPTAFSRAAQAGVRIAYSHPCFELWRLFHYQNYTSTFGGVCDSAADRVKQQPGFAQTYGPTIRSVSPETAKRVMPEQLRGRYEKARKFAEQRNATHAGRTDQTGWDPYTDVYRFVEEGLGVREY
ncbi:RloB family protein [Streptomyces sp. NBC_00059]|uniref:RloB family protein n=1 Tax=Streptomyces sp. NBC_00059 TaxID=2975635 RepID=UPI002256F570|nr:RloB family protein [Streptomyces sp. NBC_00059]MCX5410628.1 RloB family protein [Streptomyces sp. NBC_00059]